MPLPVACFGKLPFHREFLRVGLGSAAAAWVTGWVEGAHEAWSRAGEAPAASPLIRFAALPAGGELVAGVVRQSSDGLRRHPVAFFVEDARGAARDDWHLLPLALAGPWEALGALFDRDWTDVASLTAALAAGVPAPDVDAARLAYRAALAAPLGAPAWTAFAGADGDAARHAAATLLAVCEAQRAARSAAEGVSVAMPLPSEPAVAVSRASLWLELLAVAAGPRSACPALTLGGAPLRLVAFYRPPEGRDLAAVLSSLEMAPIDDVTEPWQPLPEPDSPLGRAIDALVGGAGGSLADLPARIRGAIGA